MGAQAEYQIEGMDSFAPPQSYALHNASDEPIVLQYAGEERVLPPFTKMTPKVPSRLDGPLLDSKGNPRPGTICIYDVPGERGAGDGFKIFNWSARDAIKHALGIDTKKGVAAGPMVEKGVSFVPANCTDEQFARIAREGRARYMRFLEQHATEIVSAYDERNNNRVKAGMGRLPGDSTYQRALAILEAARRRDTTMAENLIKSFEDQMAAPIEVSDDDEEFRGFVRMEAERVVRQQGLQTDTDKLIENLEKNPEAMAKFRHKYKVRKLRESRKSGDDGVAIGDFIEQEDGAA